MYYDETPKTSSRKVNIIEKPPRVPFRNMFQKISAVATSPGHLDTYDRFPV